MTSLQCITECSKVVKMKVSDLKPNSNFEVLKVRILSKQPPREVNLRDGRTSYVVELLVVDETGTSALTLWGATAADNYKVGNVIEIQNGWAKEWNNKIQISLGKGGKVFPADDDPSLPTAPPE